MQCVRMRHMASVYLKNGDKYLLLYRIGSRVIDSSWIGTAGGHFEINELGDPEACVLRELHEETGLTADDIQNLALRYVTQRLKNGEIRQNHYFFADLKRPELEIESNEGTLKWFSEAELPSLSMPHSAKAVILHYLSEGKHTRSLYAGASTESGCAFTELTEF